MAKIDNGKMKKVLGKLNDLSAEDKTSPIFQFVERIFTEKKYPADLTTDVKKILRDDLMRRLNDFITVRTIAALTDEDILTLNKMLDEKKPDKELQQFVSTHIPDYTNFLTATLLEFREVYLGLNPPADVAEAPSSPPPPPAPVAPPAPVNKDHVTLNKMN